MDSDAAGHAMSTWLRLTLITMTVGGGFTGVALTAQMLFTPQVQGPALVLICTMVVLLYLFVLASGLLFVQNPQRTMPLLVALALQIPIVSSPIIAFRFAAGFHVSAGLSEAGLFGFVRLGSEWQFNLLQPLPWGLGVNLVAVALIVALCRSSASRRRQAPS